MFKVEIVGPEEAKWPNETQRMRAKDTIEILLSAGIWQCANNHIFHGVKLFPTVAVSSICKICGSTVNTNRVGEVTLVSGGCPVSVCDNCGRRSFSKPTDPLVGYVECEFCGQKKKRRAGGVDIWAEIAADKIGIQKQIFQPQVNSWPSIWKCPKCTLTDPSKNYIQNHLSLQHGVALLPLEMKGYMARNLDVARSVNVGYCVVPALESFCKHHRQLGHPTNGGCWTILQTAKLGKPVALVIIA